MAEVGAEIAIAGGGPVGAALALGLARQGKNVALIDRAVPANRKGKLGFDLRTVALNLQSAALLDDLGAWNGLERCAYDEMQVWETRGTRRISFSADEVGSNELGWIVEVGELTEGLWRLLEGEPNVRLVTGSTITEVQPRPDEVRITCEGDVVSAQALIAADGGQSAVRRLLGVGTTDSETGHEALATVVETAEPHKSRALQIFLPEGPLAFLPLPDRDNRHIQLD